jgi:ATP-dependent protease HslVU (ClpYQ) peptidase subunit
MTTIAAIQGNGWTAMACDSRATLEGGRYFESVASKIVDNSGILIATAGSSRGSNIVHYGWKPPIMSNIGLDKWVTTKLLPSMRKAFIEAGYEAKADGESAWNESEFLISVKGVVYHVFGDYAWEREERGIYVTGTGGELALGALEALKAISSATPKIAEMYLRTAIEIAIKHDNNSGGKIHVYTQTDS